MTFPTVLKNWIKDSYGGSRTTVCPKNIHVTSMCMMQFVKGSLPEWVETVNDVINYLYSKIRLELDRKNGSSILIACFDISTYPVKAMVEYGKRKEWRCKLCKKCPINVFSKECKAKVQCKDKIPLKFEDGPHLSKNIHAKLPVTAKQWMRFAADSRNLRYELYPLFMNALLTRPEFAPKLNETIIVSGLPCDSELISPDHVMWQFGYTPTTEAERRLLKPWDVDTMHLTFKNNPDPDRFKHVYRIQNINGRLIRHEVPEMFHSIPEADSAIFYFTKFYPNANFLFNINDGDAISIGLLRVIEDFKAGVCTLERYVALPRRTALKPGEHNWTHEYFNLVKLKCLIEEDPIYTAAGVSNPVATVVFLFILAGTDFFKGVCPGIGYKTEYKDDPIKRAKQRDGIWDTFHKRLPLFRHMVQWNIYDMIPDINAERRIVLDEDLFELFIYYCYSHKYGKTVDPDNENPDFSAVKAHCMNFKNKLKRMPTQEQIRVWNRGIQCNFNYWLKSCRNIYEDPFKKINGMPYYPYVKHDDGTQKVVASVSVEKEPVDEAYSRNFYKRIQKNTNLKKRKGISEERKISAMNIIKGKF